MDMMKKGCALLVIGVLVLLIAMIFTCPNKTDHQMALRDTLQEVANAKLQEAVNDKLGNLPLDNDALGTLVSSVGRVAIEKTSNLALDQLLQVDNYYLFSIGRIKWGEHERVVSVGVLNHVFAPSKEDIDNELHKHGL